MHGDRRPGKAMEERHHIEFCERCGVELLPADPEPLCAMCYVSDTSVSLPSLLLVTDAIWSGATPTRPASPTRLHKPFVPWRPDPDGTLARKRKIRSRRITIAIAMAALAAILFGLIPSAMSSTKPGPVHLGIQSVDAQTNAVLADLYILVGDAKAHRASPANIVCPVDGQPYVYTQYEGITTISCPDPADLGFKNIYVRTDVGIPVVN
jgi:hypothetical protein